MSANHLTPMRLAIELALKGNGKTYRNPLVGAVIVKNDHIIASGYHRKYGDLHAERMAINNCNTPEQLINSTLFVTLEPCTHFGKQPPCINAIIESGIKKVVIGQLDPNPIVHGKGVQILKEHGIEVTGPFLENEAKAINPHYNCFYEEQRPFVALKQAVSLNGKINSHHDQRTAVTNELVNERVHTERSHYQSILVGSNTVIVDDPQLLPSSILEHVPIRMILDQNGRLKYFKQYHLFETSYPIIIFSEQLKQTDFAESIQVIHPKNFEINTILQEIAKLGIQSVYVEGGSQVTNQFLDHNLYDEMITYIAPKLFSNNGLN